MLKQRADFLGNPLQGLPSSSLFFIPELISSVPYPIAEIFLPIPWVVNAGLEFPKSYLLISQGAKTAKNAFFRVFFTGLPHVFDRCAKTVCARRNPKTNVSPTMNYLSFDTSMNTVVLVVLQITA